MLLAVLGKLLYHANDWKKKRRLSGVLLIGEVWRLAGRRLYPLPRLSSQPDQIGVMEVIWAEPSSDWKICTTASPWIGLGSGTVLLHLKR